MRSWTNGFNRIEARSKKLQATFQKDSLSKLWAIRIAQDLFMQAWEARETSGYPEKGREEFTKG